MSSKSGGNRDIDSMIAGSQLPQFRLNKSLGPWSMIAIGVGVVIGGGIFYLIGITESGLTSGPVAGPAVVVSYLLDCVVCVLMGLCYAELAGMMPLAGSVYTYSYASLGKPAAWFTGWILTLEYGLTTVLLAGVFTREIRDWLADFAPGFSDRWFQPSWSPTAGKASFHFNLPAFLLLLLITFVLSRGLRAFARLNFLMVAIKCAAILLFLAVGSLFVKSSNWHPFAPGSVKGVLAASSVVIFAYLGFDCVTVAAEEATEPQRTVPIGIFVSLACCGVLYISVAAVLLGMIPYSLIAAGVQGSQPPAVYALQHFGARAVSLAVSGGILIGTISVVFVCQYAQTRIWYAMARDRLLPEVFASLHPVTRVPYWSTWIGGAALALLAGTIDVSAAGDMSTGAVLAAFVVSGICVLRLRRTQPQRPRKFRIPWMPWPVLTAVAVALCIMAQLSWLTWVRFLIWLAIGSVIFALYGRRQSRIGKS